MSGGSDAEAVARLDLHVHRTWSSGYWTHGDELNQRYASTAAELGVPTSAGSDYHAYLSSEVQVGVGAPKGRSRGFVTRYDVPGGSHRLSQSGPLVQIILQPAHVRRAA